MTTTLSPSGARTGTFLKRFVRDWRSVGAVCPSSNSLAEAMLHDVSLGPDDVVLEYGAGTGAFTRLLQERLEAVGSRAYLGIEREPDFCRVLRQRMPDMEFAEGLVEDVESHLESAGLGRPTLVVSGLPLILMPRPVMEQIVRTTARILRPGGRFRTFSYLHSYPASSTRQLRAWMRDAFDQFEMSRCVWWNCPPAFVLRGDKSAT